MSGELVIVRHAETDWSQSGRHTGLSDVPLNEAGRARARGLRERLAGWQFAAVWSSPLSRARETCELSGHGPPQLHAELVEWDYGDYDGRTTPEIRAERPGWDLWRDGCPDGEDVDAVAARADRALAALPAGDLLVFSHGHMLRVLTARALALAPTEGARFLLAPGGIGVLGHERERRVLREWQP